MLNSLNLFFTFPATHYLLCSPRSSSFCGSHRQPLGTKTFPQWNIILQKGNLPSSSFTVANLWNFHTALLDWRNFHLLHPVSTFIDQWLSNWLLTPNQYMLCFHFLLVKFKTKKFLHTFIPFASVSKEICVCAETKCAVCRQMGARVLFTRCLPATYPPIYLSTYLLMFLVLIIFYALHKTTFYLFHLIFLHSSLWTILSPFEM